jgi:thiol-disulfide isomerase/thioredoxin
MAFCSCLTAQTITGRLSLLANEKIKLMGFEGLKYYDIDSSTIAADGTFRLHYLQADYGMGYLMAKDNKPFFVILSGEDIEMRGELLAYSETIEILKGDENQLFEQYASEHPRREQSLSAWVYLRKIYEADPLFAAQKNSQQVIETEIQRIRQEDKDFLSNLPRGSFVSWYLPIRKLINSVSVVAQYRTEEIPETIAAFRDLDYTDERFYKSGLLRDAIESHFWLIENSGRTLDSVYVEMKISIDHLLENLLTDETKFNLITDHLFNLLEKRSLFEASEYLALKVLNETRCTINNDLAAQLESYRAMKKGNTAPDIVFTGDIFKNGTAIKKPTRLSEIEAAYKVVVFGAGWCPKCVEELSQIPQLYEKWKSKGVEVVFVSLDTDAISYQNFTKTFPFISICDYKKWETQAAQDYYVFATPTFFLLDSSQKIILRPNSVGQIDAWVDFYIVK